MSIALHWFLPTTGDSRSNLSDITPLSSERAPDISYLGQIARSAEQLGYQAALTPVGSLSEDAWIMTAALSQVTEQLKFLVAFRPGLISPLLLGQMISTYQRVSGNRLLLNVVTGGDAEEQARFGDYLDKDERYARSDEFLDILKQLFTGEAISYKGNHYQLDDAQLHNPPLYPKIYFAGSSQAALEVAAKHADVYLTWGEPPEKVAEKIAKVKSLTDRPIRFGIRLHVITRDTSDEAWAETERLLSYLSPEAIKVAQDKLKNTQSEGQKRMLELHGGQTDKLVVSPNLWAGIGLVRSGAGTALVGSHQEVTERIKEYHSLGIDEFILSGYPHLEEAYQVAEGIMPLLKADNLI